MGIRVPDETFVFWDIEDFPVPTGRCVKSFLDKIKKALRRYGYRGRVTDALAYGSQISMEVEEHLFQSCVFFVQRETKFDRLTGVLTGMLNWARSRWHPSPSSSYDLEQYNLIVIAKDIPDVETEFVHVLKSLKTKGFNVYLAVPDDCPAAEMPPLAIANRVWYWSTLFDGGKPIKRIDGDAVNPLDIYQEKIRSYWDKFSSDDDAELGDAELGLGDIELSDGDDDGPMAKKLKGC